MVSVSKQSDNLQLSVRANKQVSHPVTVHWKAEAATDWAKYQFLHGSIVIPAGEDRGISTITLRDLESFRGPETESRNVTHKRSRWELAEIDQMVLRLDRIEEDVGIFRPEKGENFNFKKACFLYQMN